MIKQIEKEIRDLQKALAEVQKGQAALCLQPCQGDFEIREKDEKLEELGRQAKTINGTIHDLQRKRQVLMSESIMKEDSQSKP
jgi:chromosome segregation ATPase